MRCKKCNSRLAKHDLWCVECGTQTPRIKNELSALKSMKRSRQGLKPQISSNVPAMGFSIITGAIPIALLTWIFARYVEYSTTMGLLLNLGLKSLLYSIFMPMLLLPFVSVCATEEYKIELKALLSSFRSYPRYFLFSLINALYFSLIYLICFGFPGFASDPILRLVWIVLLNYWFAISLPAPIIMERTGQNAWKAIKTSFKHLGDPRWNIYLMALLFILLNILGFTLLIFPALFTLAWSYFAIRDYVDLLIEYELLDYRI
ncbi:MAG: hypothetical protein ACOCG6_06830 [Candidatus Cloacimonadaceae bacterium]